MKITLPDGMYQATKDISYSSFKFSGGEIQVRINELDELRTTNLVKLQGRLNTSDEIQTCLLLLNAIGKVNPKATIEVFIPYLPYARQDRVCYPGEAVSRDVFLAQLDAVGSTIGNQIIYRFLDVHSPLAPEWENPWVEIIDVSRESIVSGYSELFPDKAMIVSPDKGAVDRNRPIATTFGWDMLQLEKTRDPRTGDITGMQVDPRYLGRLKERSTNTAIIVDDICDGGRTFIEAATVLREAGFEKVNLYVTHGIFSRGFDTLYQGGIDHIITTNSVKDWVPNSQLAVIKVI